MISYIIADDEEIHADFLRHQLEKIDDIRCLAVCSDAIDARKKILELQPDLLMLDIEMPALSGLELIKSLKTVPAVIFVTSHPGYAVDAFEIEALDYLMKPVAFERLLRSVDKAKVHVAQHSLAGINEIKADDDSFFIRDRQLYIKIAYKNVNYIESSGNFSIIHLTNQEKQIVLANLSRMKESLPDRHFIRVNRTTIVNKHYVTAVGNATMLLKQTEFTIGKQYQQHVLDSIVGSKFIRR